MFNNGLIAVLSCEIYVGWVTFEREMYTEFTDARNRLDEETDRFSDLPKATNVASISSVLYTNKRKVPVHRMPKSGFDQSRFLEELKLYQVG